jgi:PilZ domain
MDWRQARQRRESATVTNMADTPRVPDRDWTAKRRYPRIPVDQPITAHVYWDEMRTQAVRGRCFVMSEGGLGTTLADQLNVGEVILLQLTHALKVYATVRNVRGFKHGMEFVLLRDPQRAAIKLLVQRFAGQAARA